MNVRPDWQAEAACRGYPIEWWFPGEGPGSGISGRKNLEPGSKSVFAKARSICRECPVRVECLEYAQAERITHGLWGGLSDRQRRALRRNVA